MPRERGSVPRAFWIEKRERKKRKRERETARLRHDVPAADLDRGDGGGGDGEGEGDDGDRGAGGGAERAGGADIAVQADAEGDPGRAGERRLPEGRRELHPPPPPGLPG